jgi:hypothetical protein
MIQRQFVKRFEVLGKVIFYEDFQQQGKTRYFFINNQLETNHIHLKNVPIIRRDKQTENRKTISLVIS